MALLEETRLSVCPPQLPHLLVDRLAGLLGPVCRTRHQPTLPLLLRLLLLCCVFVLLFLLQLLLRVMVFCFVPPLAPAVVIRVLLPLRLLPILMHLPTVPVRSRVLYPPFFFPFFSLLPDSSPFISPPLALAHPLPPPVLLGRVIGSRRVT